MKTLNQLILNSFACITRFCGMLYLLLQLLVTDISPAQDFLSPN